MAQERSYPRCVILSAAKDLACIFQSAFRQRSVAGC